MKKYLYEKWKEKNNILFGEMLFLEEEFRKNGCSICGEAKTGNGKWVAHGGKILVCPHMEKFVSSKLRKKLNQQRLLLEFIHCFKHEEFLYLNNNSEMII